MSRKLLQLISKITSEHSVFHDQESILNETLQKNFKEKNPDYPEDKSKYIIVYCLFNMLSEENYKKKLITLTTDYIKNTNDKTLYQEIKNIPK